MDDPRTILAEAGVECDEMSFAIVSGAVTDTDDEWIGTARVDTIMAGYLALARLVARYKAEYERVMRDFTNTDEMWNEEAHGLDNDIAKLTAERDRYKWQRDQSVANHCETGERPAEGVASCEFCSAAIADLDRRWEEL